MTDEEITVGTSVVMLAAVPTGGSVGNCQVQAQTEPVRLRFGNSGHGASDPTATSGLLIAAGESIYLTKQQAHIAKFIRDTSASGDAKVHAIYY